MPVRSSTIAAAAWLAACSGPPLARNDDAGRPPPAAPREKSAAAILAHNPFDSTRVRLDDTPDRRGAETASCEDVEVHAVIAADPDWSFTSLAVRGQKPVLRRVGGEIGGRRVAFVGMTGVLLERDGVRCLAVLHRVEAGVPPGDGAAGRSPALPRATLAGVERVSELEYRVDRGARDRILEAQGELLGTAQIVADKVDGRVADMRIVRLKPGSVLEALGLRAGDRLTAINGFDLTSVESGLLAYARLRDASALTLAIVRDGRSHEIRYEVR